MLFSEKCKDFHVFTHHINIISFSILTPLAGSEMIKRQSIRKVTTIKMGLPDNIKSRQPHFVS